VGAKTHAVAPPSREARPVDNTDWLKTGAIILVAVDHIGYFFIDDAEWWSVFGRLAAPSFFFLMGYAATRTIPFQWIVIGIFLTLLESSNEGWSWVPLNILISFALVRLARPYVEILLQKYHWITVNLLVFGLIAVLHISGEIVDYGSSGWLWAFVGLCQRLYTDHKSESAKGGMEQNIGAMRLAACLAAASVYIWQEQLEFSFSQIQLAIFILGVCILSTIMCRFFRGPSPVQPPGSINAVVRFSGRHTLEIYAIQLAGSELIIMLMPELAA